MSAADAAAFRTRLQADSSDGATLRSGLADLEELSRGFVAGRSQAFAASAGFTTALLAEVRQLPSRIELQQVEVAGAAMVLCRRMLLAAAILFGFGLCWHAGLFPDGRSDQLEAEPAAVEAEMERLDAIIRSWGASGASGASGAVTGASTGTSVDGSSGGIPELRHR